MWTRVGYATASAILGLLAIAAAIFAWALAGRCGPEGALEFVAVLAMLLSPALLVFTAASWAIGYNAKRRALVIYGILFALALGAAGIVQAVPHYDSPPDSPQCGIDL